jgi:hypothetical protein
MKPPTYSQGTAHHPHRGVCVVVYLALFYGPDVRSYFAERREAYDKLVQQARDLRDVIKPYEEKIATATNLMDRFHMDPAKLKRSSVMAEASAAIQQAAASREWEWARSGKRRAAFGQGGRLHPI